MIFFHRLIVNGEVKCFRKCQGGRVWCFLSGRTLFKHVFVTVFISQLGIMTQLIRILTNLKFTNFWENDEGSELYLIDLNCWNFFFKDSKIIILGHKKCPRVPTSTPRDPFTPQIISHKNIYTLNVKHTLSYFTFHEDLQYILLLIFK